MKREMINPFLKGRRVFLRPVKTTDAPIIQNWHNDPELRKVARAGERPTTLKHEKQDIRAAYESKDEVYLMVVKKINNKEIGFVRGSWLTSSSRNVWLRMTIGDKQAWGKNYATDALRCFLEWLFYEQNVHRVTCETYATNRRAIRFFEKMGFKKEGVIREAHYIDGTYHDIISFGLLKREFLKTRSTKTRDN